LYIYELPTHHCPFCLLHREYGFVGYLLYAALLGGAVAGLGLGALALVQDRPSLASLLPKMQSRLTWAVLILATVFTLTVVLWMALSPLRL
jgi:hypothetical protein